jgi:hypothetical protein
MHRMCSVSHTNRLGWSAALLPICQPAQPTRRQSPRHQQPNRGLEYQRPEWHPRPQQAATAECAPLNKAHSQPAQNRQHEEKIRN